MSVSTSCAHTHVNAVDCTVVVTFHVNVASHCATHAHATGDGVVSSSVGRSRPLLDNVRAGRHGRHGSAGDMHVFNPLKSFICSSTPLPPNTRPRRPRSASSRRALRANDGANGMSCALRGSFASASCSGCRASHPSA